MYVSPDSFVHVCCGATCDVARGVCNRTATKILGLFCKHTSPADSIIATTLPRSTQVGATHPYVPFNRLRLLSPTLDRFRNLFIPGAVPREKV
jgi:hypothetical protein